MLWVLQSDEHAETKYSFDLYLVLTLRDLQTPLCFMELT